MSNRGTGQLGGGLWGNGLTPMEFIKPAAAESPAPDPDSWGEGIQGEEIAAARWDEYEDEDNAY